MNPAHFQVDPRLANILGENYRSTERALKELVDNAWDADAGNVWVDLPDAVSDQPIVVRDDGSGMTEREVRYEYLFIASDRRTREGDITPVRKRRVKGRKGIGKFAGLVAANTMAIDTRARGTATHIVIEKEAILQAKKRDLEQVGFPVQTTTCDKEEHGTTVTLSNLNQRFAAPNPEALKELLVLEYGRERNFMVYVNGEMLSLEDLPGQLFSFETELPDAGKVQFQFKVMDNGKPLSKAGIVTRVDGKVIGRPSFFGLDEREDFPKKLLNRICGEISADGLDVTADYGALIENSISRQEVQGWAQEHLHREVDSVFCKEIESAQAQLDRKIRERLKLMPEHRRQFAEDAMQRLMRKYFYDLSVAMRDTLVSLVLDAIERDEYWQVCEKIDEAKHGTIMNLAEALNSFGLVAMTELAYQAHNRLTVLSALDDMVLNTQTTELEIHKSLETNLWVLGPEYSLMSSNESLSKIVDRYTAEKFKGDRAHKRPDLLLAQDIPDRMLLIEFKKPSITLNRDHQSQAKKYRDDLLGHFRNATIDILLIGGKINDSISTSIDGDTRFASYIETINRARTQLDWLLREMTVNN